MATIDVTYDPITINNGAVTVDVNGLNDIKLTIPDPIKTDTKLTLEVPHEIRSDTKVSFSIPEPVRSDARAHVDFKADVDLRPVVLDQCLRLSLAPLPPTVICLPNRQHLGLTLFGVEVFGLTLEGEARIVVGDPGRRTQVVGRVSEHGAMAGDDGVHIRLDK